MSSEKHLCLAKSGRLRLVQLRRGRHLDRLQRGLHDGCCMPV